MQLFVLDRVPECAARMLCDVHIIKMCLECGQILSAVAVRQNLPLAPGMPGIYNINHPVITALNSRFKINWTLRHNSALHKEFAFRFGKAHAYGALAALYREMLFDPGDVPEDWSFARNFSGMDIAKADIVDAYREYYRFKKSVISNWHYSRRSEPRWLNENSG